MSRLIACLLLMLSILACAEDPLLELPAIDGQRYAPLALSGKKVTLLFFIDAESFQTEYFAEEMNFIAAEYVKDVSVFLVHSNRKRTLGSASEHAKRHYYKVPVLLDNELKLARKVQARVHSGHRPSSHGRRTADTLHQWMHDRKAGELWMLRLGTAFYWLILHVSHGASAGVSILWA